MDDSARDVPPSVWLIMIGDALHSLIAGLAIGTAFSVNIFTGLSVGIAIVLEQLPHELGNDIFYLRNRSIDWSFSDLFFHFQSFFNISRTNS